MSKKGSERKAHAAAIRITGERFCHGHNAYTKTETTVYRGRHYCTACTARLSAQRKANASKGKA